MSGDKAVLKEVFFQDGEDVKEPKLFRGQKDTRDHDNRPSLPPIFEKLLNALDDRQKSRCRTDCTVPAELRPHMGHITSIIKEKGKGEGTEQGLINFRDQDKQIEKMFSTRAKIIDRALMVVTGAGALYVVQKILPVISKVGG
jgi:hypothetical protein